MHSPATAYYFERFGFCPAQVEAAPKPDLGLAVVIPCFNEPHLTRSLEALWRCERPRRAVEVMVVINAPEGSGDAAQRRNEQSLREAEAWRADRHDPRLEVRLLYFPGLPRKRAGVGLARKIGMDEALRRFDRAGRLDGVITCFDADCLCDPNYLRAIEDHFEQRPDSPGSSIYFEHPLEGPEDGRVYEAAALYELHLRYYVEALRYAGFPHAFHTVGSSMAVRAEVYQKQGGMNKRQAGEDFYFLHKVIPLGGFTEINTTRVIASPRVSDRVPFGTGRAVGEFLDTGRLASYPLEAFEDLREFFTTLDPGEGPLREFLAGREFDRVIAEIRQHTASERAFRKRFFQWFDGFLVMKYVHFARDTRYGSAEPVPAARELFQRRTGRPPPEGTRELLSAFRAWQRHESMALHEDRAHLLL